MSNWSAWVELSNGPYQGQPELASAGLGASGFLLDIQDSAGNVVRLVPAQPGQSGGFINTGGAGVIDHLPTGGGAMGGVLAVGNDRCLYRRDYDPQRGYAWRILAGPGRFLSPGVSWPVFTGAVEVLGEGTEHQLAYAYLPKDRQDEITAWVDVGRPGEPGGAQGINGRPAVARDAGGVHVFARGQDNHLWHIYGTDADNGRSFGRWHNLGGGLTDVPVAIHSQSGIDCFVLGENRALFVNSWDGARWSGFQAVGGQLQGIPAATSFMIGNKRHTMVIGRGADNHLKYRDRVDGHWQAWQSAGGGLKHAPAIWSETRDSGNAVTVTCLVVGEDGGLWQRERHLP